MSHVDQIRVALNAGIQLGEQLRAFDHLSCHDRDAAQLRVWRLEWARDEGLVAISQHLAWYDELYPLLFVEPTLKTPAVQFTEIRSDLERMRDELRMARNLLSEAQSQLKGAQAARVRDFLSH